MVSIPPDARQLLEKRVMAIYGTLLPDGAPHAVAAGVVVDGDELVAHTDPGAQRVKNLRNDPRINVLAVDPENPRIYVEVRGVASLRVCGPEDVGPHYRAQAEKYGLPAIAGEMRPGMTVVQIRITPLKVRFFSFTFDRMGPKSRPRAD